MPETKTLSKVERFALASARDKIFAAQNDFNEIAKEVCGGHGIPPDEMSDWSFSPDGAALIRTPKRPVDLPPLPPPPADPPEKPKE